MKTFYVRVVAKTYGECLIEAQSLEEAQQIAQNIDVFDTDEKTESYELEYLEELNNKQIDLYDLPTLKQTKEGYEVNT